MPVSAFGFQHGKIDVFPDKSLSHRISHALEKIFSDSKREVSDTSRSIRHCVVCALSVDVLGGTMHGESKRTSSKL